MEWLSPVAFRLARSWRGEGDVLPRIRHERTVPELEDSGATFTMRTRYLTVDLDRADLNLRVTAADTPVAKVGLLLTAGGVELGLRMAQDEKVFGLMGSDSGRLNLRGERLERRHGLFFTSRGYGIFMRAPERCAFDLASGTVQARGSQTEVFDRAVDVQISRLRRKLHACVESEIIKTYRGAGYLFDAKVTRA